MNKRKCKYEVVARRNDYAVKKSGRVIMTGRSRDECEQRLCGWLGLEKLPCSNIEGKTSLYA